MNNVGFAISDKENELRRAILPPHISLLNHPEMVLIEAGYGTPLGITDAEYEAAGAKVVSSAEARAADVVCDPKIGDAGYLAGLSNGQTVFGWVHAVQNRDITDTMIEKKLSAYAWEEMYDKGRHVFWRNNELAGEAAVMHAFQCFGSMPYENKVAVIGRGNTAHGVVKVLNMLGADVVQYDRKSTPYLRDELGEYDVIVNCVLWDVYRKDHLIYREDLARMKSGSMIVDVSCDRGGGVETSVPTTIENPTYRIDGVLHYVVDHTPALFHKTFTRNNSKLIYPYIDELILGKPGAVLQAAHIFENGRILDKTIADYQNRPFEPLG